MELKYKQLLEDNDLQVSDLSNEAQILIEQLNSTLMGVNMIEKSGKEASEKTLNKIEALDNLVCKEIAEQLNESEEEEETEEEETEEEIDEEEAEEEEEEAEEMQTEIIAEPNDPKGLQIDLDLKTAFDSGKTKITLEELKAVSKTAYSVVFDNYDESGDNGLTTTNYSLIETEENIFTLTKK